MNRRSSFFRILITYVIVLIIPFAIGLVAYGTTYRTVSENYRKNRQALLQQALVHVSGNMKIADSIATGIILDPKIRLFSQIEEPFEGTTLFKVIENMKALDNYMIGGDIIRDYYVVYENGAVLGPGRAYHAERFYPGQLEISGIDRSEWVERLYVKSSGTTLIGNRDVKINALPEDIITYVRPLFDNADKKSLLLILLDNRSFSNVFREFPLEKEGWVAMVDSRGEIITSYPPESPHLSALNRTILLDSPGEYESEGLAFTLNYAYPKNRDWFLVSAMPRGVVSQEVIKVRNVIAGCIILTIMLGGGIVLFVAMRTFKPVELLINDNDSLKKALVAQKPYLRQAFLGRLIRGEFHRAEEIALYLEQTGIELSGRRFSVVLVHMEEDEAPLATAVKEQLLLSDIIHQTGTGHRVYHRPRDIHGLTILFIHPGADGEVNSLVIDESIETWNSLAQPGISSSLSWGIGNDVDSPMEISRSYEEALRALNYGRTHDSPIPVHYKSIVRGNEENYSYLNLETRLRNLVAGGYHRETADFLDNLEERFIHNSLPGSLAARALAGDLFSTVTMIINTNLVKDGVSLAEIKEELRKVNLNDPTESSRCCRRALLKMTELISKQKKSHNEPLINRIESFLNENYQRKDLNLAVVSEQFDITETYLSHFFKEQKGINFCVYLRDFRLDQAKELLEKGEHSVNEVVDLVGYGSYATFARLFKQMNGISAGKYRERFKSQ